MLAFYRQYAYFRYGYKNSTIMKPHLTNCLWAALTLALALGLFISTLVEHQATAMVFSVILLMLPVIMLSRMIFPVESMPALLQWVSNIVPAKWYISITRKLMVQGVEFRYIIKELAILAGMTAFMIMIALKNLKNRL